MKALLVLLLALLAAPASGFVPFAHGQTTEDKLRALTTPPIWRVDTLVYDLGGNPHTRLLSSAQPVADTAWAFGNGLDSLLTWMAYVDGAYRVVDPHPQIAADSLYTIPPGDPSGLFPRYVADEWESGARWIDRYTMVTYLQVVKRIFDAAGSSGQ